MKRTVITCPRCGAEYLAQEIYLPTAFFGKANYIERSEDTHKILEVYGTDIDTEECYTCNYCDTPFRVSAKISFSVKEDTDHNFNEDYTTILATDKILLSED